MATYSGTAAPQPQRSFPKKFLLQIIRRFIFCIIPSGLMAGGLIFVFQPPEDLIVNDFLKVYAMISLIFIGLGLAYSFLYKYFLTNYDLYRSYGSRRPAGLFLGMLLVFLFILVCLSVGFGLLFFLNSSLPIPYIPFISLALISVFGFCLGFFALEFVFVVLDNSVLTCKHCKLTNSGLERNENEQTKSQSYSAHDNGGIYTEHIKVNDTDVTVEYHTEPEYYTIHETTVTGTHVYYCRHCDRIIKKSKYKHTYRGYSKD